MKTYKFKLYKSKKNRQLHRQINAAGSIYNHCIALHKRYYRIFGKHLNLYKLMKHIAKLRKRIKYWQQVGSQAVQDICQRIDKAYKLFFKQSKSGTRPPNFKKTRKYKSYTLKQAGYKFLADNKVRIGNKVYKFSKSRELKGKVKTLTVKRNPLDELFIIVVTDFIDESFGVVTGKIAGFDFGLKTFLTASDLTTIKSPLFFKEFRTKLKAASRKLSSKKKGSNNWYKAKDNLNRVHEQISHKRKDWFWKLAHQLTNEYDVLIFEDLNLNGMKRLWGRKVSDLAFSTFLEILETVANKKGKTIHVIDRFYPSSKTCFDCGYHNKELSLKERSWDCPNCGEVDRDLNAAKNIQREGASSLGLGDVSHSLSAIAA
ncbi:MAG: transposase [Xenococcus sp. MO_188.B8]|nr:transposase [Xenococcus sp. MO_188.B8]